MKVEMLSKGNIEKVLGDNNIPYSVRYNGDTYKVIEMVSVCVMVISILMAPGA